MNIGNMVWACNLILFICYLVICIVVYDVKVGKFIGRFFIGLAKLFGKINSRKEVLYNRSVEIGKIKAKQQRHKIYRFFNDLIIDLGVKRYGITPTSFIFLLSLFSILLSLVISGVFLSTIWISIPLVPLVFSITLCLLYTRANVVHDLRITSIIDSENLICNNIKDGVLSSVRQSIDLFPEMLREDYISFVENVELKNYHIKDALMELSNNLGSVSEEFIKKCIFFELEEEHGIAESFQDVIEVNNTKTELRIDMKRKFEALSKDFTISATLIGVVFLGSLVMYENIRDFYFTTVIGNLILCLDVLIILGAFGYMTYLRARDLT